MKKVFLLFCICLVAGLVVMSTSCDKLKESTPKKATETKPATSGTVEKPAEPVPANPAE